MTWPTTGLLDNFNRGDEGPPPSASWDGPAFPGDGEWEVASLVCRPDNASSTWCDDWWTTSFGPDCEVYNTMSALCQSPYEYQVMARLADPGTASISGFYAEVVTTAGPTYTWKLWRLDSAASFTQIGATGSGSISAGDKIGFECIGENLKLYRYTGGAWDVQVSTSSASYNRAGYIGFSANSGSGANNIRVEDFSGGTVVTGGGTNFWLW